MNMALDEVAAETVADGGPRTVRVYQWSPSTLSLGYHQASESVDWAFCEREGISVTRRPTGGGGIYHDEHGDVSYSIVAPADELPGNLMETYELLCEPVFDAFRALGIDARFTEEALPEIHGPACYLRELHPAHDVVAGEDAKKISGNAQYRRRDAIIQHGSLTYEVDAERHLATFADHDVTPEAFRGRVTSIREQAGAERAEAVAALEDALAAWAGAEEGAWTDAELAAARERVTDKFGADRWNRDRED